MFTRPPPRYVCCNKLDLCMFPSPQNSSSSLDVQAWLVANNRCCRNYVTRHQFGMYIHIYSSLAGSPSLSTCHTSDGRAWHVLACD